ncbi:uncharacterized protein K441DRAFT_580327, partial [Cenococcum geophilum 1.58]|uniref:uncharacterized protein n=1 Tax=Cenococcum geophilum 1.58 TaxID=794803 RepID=UPI00358EB99A
RYQLAVRRKGDRANIARIAFKRTTVRPRRRLPQPDSPAVRREGDRLAVRREGDRADVARMAFKRAAVRPYRRLL